MGPASLPYFGTAQSRPPSKAPFALRSRRRFFTCAGAFDVMVVIEADSFDRTLGVKLAAPASGATSELHILEPIDPAAALKQAGVAAKWYTPAG
jgi:hypothetical protein